MACGRLEDSPAYHLEEEETTRQVREAISSLPLSHRGVVALYYVNDLSVQEIAEIMEVPVGTIKRHATGKGNAPKEAMIAAARARGFSPADDNEADAIAILHWAIETNGGLG